MQSNGGIVVVAGSVVQNDGRAPVVIIMFARK